MAGLQLFTYHQKQVRTKYINGQVWFVCGDVCEALSIGNVSDTISRLDEDEFDRIEVENSAGRSQKTYVVNEPGLYNLILRSSKPEAKAFKRWVIHEVLPAIRKTGRYRPQHQGVLPLEAHTDTEVQKDMSKSVNALNYQRGGKEATMEYNIHNAVAHTGRTPAQLKRDGKLAGLKSKDRVSGKAVVRVTQPGKACCMSLADNLVEQGFEPDKVFGVTKTAEIVFDGILELGATPAELGSKGDK